MYSGTLNLVVGDGNLTSENKTVSVSSPLGKAVVNQEVNPEEAISYMVGDSEFQVKIISKLSLTDDEVPSR